MNDAKERHGFIKITLKADTDERQAFDAYFTSRPALKKGETIKRWILSAIRDAEAISQGKTQADPAIGGER